MDAHHTSVFVNQEFSYSSLLETGICNIRHFKIHYYSAICRNDWELGMRAGETSDLKPSKLHFSIFLNG
jgi:hypothetical protein